MSKKHTTVRVPQHAQKGEDPATEPPMHRAKYNKKNSNLPYIQRVFIAIFLSPVYQTVIAGIAAVGLILMGGHHGI